LQGFLLQVDEAKVVAHEADDPYPLIHLAQSKLLACAFGQRLATGGVGLVAACFQAGDALLQGRGVQVGNSAFYGVVEAFEPRGRGSALVGAGLAR